MKQSSVVKSFINAPYLLWSVLFIIAPMIMVVYYAFTDRNGDWTLANITALGAYSQTFIRSIWYVEAAYDYDACYASYVDEFPYPHLFLDNASCEHRHYQHPAF